MTQTPGRKVFVERIQTLPPKDGEEVAAIFRTMAQGFAERQRENMRDIAVLEAAEEIMLQAQERERVAGRPADPDMTLGNALEILGRWRPITPAGVLRGSGFFARRG